VALAHVAGADEPDAERCHRVVPTPCRRALPRPPATPCRRP
jgi:hypothetical protein